MRSKFIAPAMTSRSLLPARLYFSLRLRALARDLLAPLYRAPRQAGQKSQLRAAKPIAENRPQESPMPRLARPLGATGIGQR